MHRPKRSSPVGFLLTLLLGFAPLIAVPHGAAQTPTSAKAGAATTAAKVSGAPLDLNTATPDQLKSIPGIGDAYAKRIVEGRPYTAKNQLVTKGILPSGVYDKIKDSIVAKRAKS